MKKTLTFDDVLLTPLFSTLSSRKDANTQTKLKNLTLDLGVISSNMDTVTNENMAKAMNEFGAGAALHRFQSIEQNVEMFMKSPASTFVSIGISEAELDRAQALINVGARNFIIDVANGASSDTVKQYKALRRILGHFDCHVMVGNFATAHSIHDFIWNLNGSQKPDSFKVGVGGGSACLTRVVTGVGIPTFSSVMDCVTTGYDIIADGGIRNSGDLSKCFAAGAKAVMLGSVLAATEESPGEVISHGSYEVYHPEYSISELRFKKYRGSASAESYNVQGKTASHRSPEGDSMLLPYKGPVKPILEQLKAGLQSSMSYLNARNLAQFRENAEFVEVTGNGLKENGAHGKK